MLPPCTAGVTNPGLVYAGGVVVPPSVVLVAAAKAQKDADFTQQNQVQEYAAKIQKYQAELGVYQAEVANEVQEYTQNLQADGVGYQWLQDQYSRLKAEYDQAFMIAAPQEQGEGQ